MSDRASFKMDLLLSEAELISNISRTSVITYIRRENKKPAQVQPEDMSDNI